MKNKEVLHQAEEKTEEVFYIDTTLKGANPTRGRKKTMNLNPNKRLKKKSVDETRRNCSLKNYFELKIPPKNERDANRKDHTAEKEKLLHDATDRIIEARKKSNAMEKFWGGVQSFPLQSVADVLKTKQRKKTKKSKPTTENDGNQKK